MRARVCGGELRDEYVRVSGARSTRGGVCVRDANGSLGFFAREGCPSVALKDASRGGKGMEESGVVFLTHPTAVTVPTHPSSNTTVTASVRMLIVFLRAVRRGCGARAPRFNEHRRGPKASQGVKWFFAVVDGRRKSCREKNGLIYIVQV